MRKLLILHLFFFALRPVICQTPFDCTGQPFILGRPDHTFYPMQFNLTTADVLFCDSIPTQPLIHTMGYRVTDHLIYGINNDEKAIYRIDAQGNTELLSPLKVSRQFHFDASAVTPDGKYLVAMGSLPEGITNVEDVANLLFVDLESGDYTQTATPLHAKSGYETHSEDIAFHPVTGELFGFGSFSHRLFKIIPDSQLIDDVSFPPQMQIAQSESFFFDPFGNLFLMGRPPRPANSPLSSDPNFYKVDVTTGKATFFAPAQVPRFRTDSDACSCPYIVAIEQTISPEAIFRCTEANVMFRIGNQTGIEQTGITLEQEFPAQTIIKEVLYNPFGGDIGNSIGTNQLRISGLNIPNGGDSLLIRIEVGELPYGEYDLQAQLLGVDQPNRNEAVVLSDNPATCLYQDPTPLRVEPLFVDLGDVPYFCEGESTVLDGFIGDEVSYLWNDGSKAPYLQISTPGEYALTVSTSCDMAVGSVMINYADLSVDLGPDPRIDLGDEIIIRPSVRATGNFLSYQWFAGSDSLMADQCGNCEELPLQPIENGSYTLHLTDEFGCTAEDMINIFVQPNYKLFLPNAFSPNNDGINDILFPQSKTNARVLSFEIFDRWGTHIFSSRDISTNDTTSGWDGQFQNQPAAGGIYVWTIVLEFFDGETRQYTGDVLLLP